MGRRNVKGKKAGIIHKEAFQRMNYLYQASYCVLIGSPSNLQLARFYAQTLKTISKRLVLKIDPSIKRTICKNCDTPLLPGVTCTHRVKAKRAKHMAITCLTCGALKRYLACVDYKLWSEQDENISDYNKI